LLSETPGGAIPIIASPEGLPPALAASLSAEERAWIEHQKTAGFPMAVTPHFASLAGAERADPIRRQFVPDPLEARNDPFALGDPLGEGIYRAAPRLVHQYRDRALLLAGGTCAGFCRYCFRRVRMSAPAAFIGERELPPVSAYLRAHPEIKEILVSGGDPLTAPDAELDRLFDRLREARPGVLIRLCSRVPVAFPARLGQNTVALLARRRPLRIVTHINHPRELAPEARLALGSAVGAGIPVHVQTVLLRGINDNAETLAALFRECLNLGLTPYYLFQLDLAPGAAHFRVPLKEGLFIYRELGRLVSGLGLPAYGLDLPGGGGKIRLHEDIIAGEEARPGGRVYLLKDSAGGLWEYPVG
jgi:lysine 2,3-aminomutase